MSTTTNVIWTPHPGPQREVLTRIEFEIGYGGARGGGKTDAGIAWFTRWIHIPQLRGLVIRRNSSDLNDWLDRARILYNGIGGQVLGNPPEVRFPSGAKIRTGHLKDDNAYTKYQGHEYPKMVIEELTQIPKEEQYLMLLGSCRSTSVELKPQVFTTFNPGGLGHEWVKKRFGIEGSPKHPIATVDHNSGRKRIFIPARVTDNPTLISADPDYLKFLDSLPETLRKAWRDGDFSIFAGQFFSEWSPDRHVVKPFKIPDSWKKLRAIDISGHAGVTACLWLAIDYDGTVWAYREYFQTGKDADQHAREITSLSTGEHYNYTVVDNSAFAKIGLPETIAEVYRRNGVDGLVPSTKDRIMGWNFLHTYLRWDKETMPRLRVFETCSNFIRTIPSLIHDERNPEDIQDMPGTDDLADACRYALQTLRDQSSQRPLTEIERKLQEFKRMHEPSINNFYYPT